MRPWVGYRLPAVGPWDSTERDVGYDMLCPGHSYTPEYGHCQAFTGVFARFSDLGRQLGVLLFADQVLELAGVVHMDTKQPP